MVHAGGGRLVTVGRLADRGILAAPGTFYGTAGAQHVRIALTASDERIGPRSPGWPDRGTLRWPELPGSRAAEALG